MARLRHLALIVDDPDASAAFCAKAFGMERVADIPAGCHMTDGTVSIALLRRDPGEEIGIDHFGLLVDDLDATAHAAVAAGASLLSPVPSGSHAAYEMKLRTPDGMVFDLSDTGWPGATGD